MTVPLPPVDDGVRQRLTRRFGPAVDVWFDELPDLLRALASRWGLDFGAPIPRGSVSVVNRCRLPDGRQAVLKVSPDRARIASEASALANWMTPHTPTVIAADGELGALLIEAIVPGTPLVESARYPELASIAELLNSLHADGTPSPSCPPVAERVAYLFDSSAKMYVAYPNLVDLVPPELYEHGRRLALTLADDRHPPLLLHGDLTPSNILDSGAERRLVAIDPAPCLGDAAFDAVDLVLWQADDIATIEARCRAFAVGIRADPERLLAWCTAFAAMAALDIASSHGPREQVNAVAELAARAP